jgi:hypothetical protein
LTPVLVGQPQVELEFTVMPERLVALVPAVWTFADPVELE